MQNKRPIVLLDIDETLIISAPNEKPIYNNILIDALKTEGVRDTYLFSRMLLDNIDSIKGREELKKWLVEEGFTVHGIITPSDVTWEDLSTVSIKWSDFSVQNLDHNRHALFHKETGQKLTVDEVCKSHNVPIRAELRGRRLGVAYDDACRAAYQGEESFASLIIKSRVAISLAMTLHNGRKPREDINNYLFYKGAMLELFTEAVKEQSDLSWIDRIIVIDDEEEVCECLNASIETFKCPIPIDIIRAEAADNNEVYYQSRLRDIFHPGWRGEQKKRLLNNKGMFFKHSDDLKNDPKLFAFMLLLSLFTLGFSVFLLYKQRNNMAHLDQPGLCPSSDEQENTCSLLLPYSR